MALAKKASKPADLVIHDCEQSSDAWFQARLGLATASEFSTIMAGGEQKGRTTLLRKLAGEIITGKPMTSYQNAAMERGKVMEAEARDWYARTRFVDVEQVGFVYNPDHNAGWSPDGLVGTDGAIEIKTAEPHILIGILEKGTFPSEHRAQTHGGLWVGRRQWIDLIIYWPGLPKYVARIERDENYYREMSDAIEVFNYDLKKLVERIRRMA